MLTQTIIGKIKVGHSGGKHENYTTTKLGDFKGDGAQDSDVLIDCGERNGEKVGTN